MKTTIIRKLLGIAIACLAPKCWAIQIEGVEAWSGMGLPECSARYRTRDEVRKAAQDMGNAMEETDSEYDRQCIARIKHIKTCRAMGVDPWSTPMGWASVAA